MTNKIDNEVSNWELLEFRNVVPFPTKGHRVFMWQCSKHAKKLIIYITLQFSREKKTIVHHAKIEQQHYSLSELLSLLTWCPTEPWAHTRPTLPGKPFLRAHPARPQPRPRIKQSTCFPVMKAWLIARLLAKQTQYLPQLHEIRIFFFFLLS